MAQGTKMRLEEESGARKTEWAFQRSFHLVKYLGLLSLDRVSVHQDWDRRLCICFENASDDRKDSVFQKQETTAHTASK